jgi:hypothetical protein
MTRMAHDRRPLRRTPGLRFAKLLGTGTGQRFTVRDSDPTRWALVAAWDKIEAAAAFEHSRLAIGWGRIAGETGRVDLRPLRSRGSWAGRQPFGDPSGGRPAGPVAAITRARLRPGKAVTFWRAVPPVSAALTAAPGLLFALGIGELPIGLQGTFSLWRDSAALTRYAYGAPAHVAAVRRTSEIGWYAEELFARFEVLALSGTLDRQNPLV